MSTVTKEPVVTYIENLSVIDLSNLVKELETKFGVSAAPVAVAMACGAARSEEHTS
jgi:large subunit ribosomal protein L7/L12